MELVLETNTNKKKQLIKEVLNYYRESNYPLFFYQFNYEGKIKHISSRSNHMKMIDLQNTDSYYRCTIPKKERKNIIINDIRDIFSINDFVNDICSLNSPSEFIFPKIESEYLNNLNLYQLCLDYKCYRDMLEYLIKLRLSINLLNKV
jgi:hypothetical protein